MERLSSHCKSWFLRRETREWIAIFTNCRLYDRRFITSSTLSRNKDSFVVRHFYGFTRLRWQREVVLLFIRCKLVLFKYIWVNWKNVAQCRYLLQVGEILKFLHFRPITKTTNVFLWMRKHDLYPKVYWNWAHRKSVIRKF